jgi:hypothetical protein
MYALQIVVTYILLSGIPLVSVWLSFKESRVSHLSGFYIGVISVVFALIGILDITRAVSEGRTLSAGEIITLIVFLGSFSLASGFGTYKNFILAYR